MGHNDYKPLTDDELRGVFLPRDKDDVTYLLLREQARRANAAMKALRDYNSGTLPWSKVMEVVEAYDGND